MIRDITIGQYYKADSVIHRLDPRVKLMGTLIFIISLFMGMNIWIYAVVTVALAVVIKMSRIHYGRDPFSRRHPRILRSLQERSHLSWREHSTTHSLTSSDCRRCCAEDVTA